MAFVDDGVADGLTDQVVGDGPALQAVFLQELVARGEVRRVGEGLVDLEVVAPAGEFQSVVAEVAGQTADLFEGKVGPLAGERA
ncbi:hypothetical protein QF037_002075 [Streptomyces canus]|nr:hypothetical protein [Streptomyces canus]